MIKAVIFDLCGVLTHDVWEHMYFDQPDGLAARFGLDLYQLQQVGRTLWHAFAYRSAQTPLDCARLEQEYWTTFIRIFDLPVTPEYLAGLTDHFIYPVPGMRELVAELSERKVELLICSDNSEFFFERQMRKLNLVEFYPDPEKIVLSSRTGVSKSDPSLKMFRTIEAALTCDVSECLYIDDRAENIVRALECGISGILFPAANPAGSNYLRQLLALFPIHQH